MICLALECSTRRRSVAVARDDLVLARAVHDTGRDTPLFRMIADVLGSASVVPEQVGCVAVGLGPGSYTGIRIAIAAAQGWAAAHEVRLIGIDSVLAVAHEARRLGHRGLVAAAADAHRGEFYVAEYDLRADVPMPVTELRIVGRPDIEALHAAGRLVVGPDLEIPGVAVEEVFPEAGRVATLAHAAPTAVAPEDLRPIYLRSTTFVKAPAPSFARRAP
ncbi:MAG: tRNA (adenosine(37)-N6)-threonylcarbamoyltransferase complex dimerization subunit type 1 TsaB [Verrucomicrobiales bacterium]|nr:tRNA (adenosine(37)-N6)-threonylcarbamoyltransferase complex dimerization subunit type 1 TsaB [Verrucomicrobiales bacterium]